MDNYGSGRQIRLLLVDEQTLFHEGLSRLIASVPDLRVVGQFSSPPPALRAMSREPADLLLVDCRMARPFLIAPRPTGVPARILLLARPGELAACIAAMCPGVSGVFLHDRPLDCLLDAIRMVASGHAWFDQRVIRLLVGGGPLPARSKPLAAIEARDRQIVQGISEGLTNQAIARRVGLSEAAVKAALRRLFRQTEARTRSQLVRRVLERYPEVDPPPGGARFAAAPARLIN
jgi:DNA-binding NarL/FixJ family response regulator